MRAIFWTIAAIFAAGCTGASASGSGGAGAASTASTTGTAIATGAGGSDGGPMGAGGATGACSTCDGASVDLHNDPRHCGSCGNACAPGAPTCDRGTCAAPACEIMGAICPLDHLCCGMECCPAWKICCHIPDAGSPTCVPADAGACPTSCAGGA